MKKKSSNKPVENQVEERKENEELENGGKDELDTPWETAFSDLPGELLCLIGLYIQRRDLMSFLLLQKDIDPLLSKHGFYETKLVSLGVEIDPKISDLKKKYILILRRKHHSVSESANIELKVLKKSYESGKYFNFYKTPSSETFDHSKRHYKISVLQPPEKKQLVILTPKICQLGRLRDMDARRVRIVRYYFQINLYGKESKIGVFEEVLGSDLREGISFSLGDLGLERMEMKDDDIVEMTLTLEDQFDILKYSIALWIRGVTIKPVESGREFTHSKRVRLNIFASLTQPGEMLSVVDCCWGESEMKKKIDAFKREHRLENNFHNFLTIRRLSGNIWKVGSVLPTINKRSRYFARRESEEGLFNDDKKPNATKIEESIIELWKIQHENIVKIENFYVEDFQGEYRKCYFFLEYMNCGTLDKVMKTVKKVDSERAVSQITRQILSGLKYLHEKVGCVYRELKPSRIHFNDRGYCKIADFVKTNDLFFHHHKFRAFSEDIMKYMSPERMRGERHSFNADIWSLGLLVVEMVTGRYPLPFSKNMNLFDSLGVTEKIVSGKMVLREGHSFSEEFVDFVYKCLVVDSSERWEASQLLNHEFIKKHELIKKPSFRYWLHKKYIDEKKKKMRRRRKR